jgi:radical SAM superfamily enzyme YgiQ (UPF0313 family)
MGTTTDRAPRILFSNPPWWEADWTNAVDDTPSLRQGIRAGSRWPFTRPAAYAPNAFRWGAYLPFPFFLAHAAAYTQRLLPAAIVEIRDSIARGEDYNAYATALQRFAPTHIVIETATSALKHDRDLFRALAQLVPEARIILAGPIDTATAPALLADHPNLCAIVQGEYDKQIAKVITATYRPSPIADSPAPPSPLAHRQLWPHDLLTPAELATAPAPMFDEPVALHYWDANPLFKDTATGRVGPPPAPHLQLWTSRGCPFKCIFCVWPATMTGNDPDGTRPRAVRFHSMEYLENFIRDRLRRAADAGRPIQSLYLDDDTFNLTDRHTLAVSAVLKRIGLPWSAMCRADTITRDTWRAMRDAGCYGVKLGFESGSQQVIDTIVNKRLNLREAADTARWLRAELGLTVHGTFTIGLPGETPAQAQETRDFIADLYTTGGLDTHQLSGTAEIEGTPLHTLHAAGHLEKYAAAKIDAHYVASPDGQKKIETLK